MSNRTMYNHLLISPISEPQKEYATASRTGRLGCKLGEDGYLLPAYRGTIEPKKYAQRINPNDTR